MKSSFLFDIFLGHSYNQLPPSVKYMTVNIRQFDHLFRAHKSFCRPTGASFGSTPTCMQYVFLSRCYRERMKHFFQGRKSLPIALGNVGGTGLGTWEIYVTSGKQT